MYSSSPRLAYLCPAPLGYFAKHPGHWLLRRARCPLRSFQQLSLAWGHRIGVDQIPVRLTAASWRLGSINKLPDGAAGLFTGLR